MAGEDTYKEGESHPSRSNLGDFDLLFVTEGRLFMKENGKNYELGVHDYLILSPNGAHGPSSPCTERTHFYWLHFRTKKVEEDVSETQYSLREYGNVKEVNDFLSYFQSLVEEGGTIHGENYWEMEILFLKLMMNLINNSEKPQLDQRVVIANRAADFISQNFKKKLTYKTLADKLHYHENHIALCMKHKFGMTPIAYLQKCRLDHAKWLLKHRSTSITLIAEISGFSSHPYFIRCFKNEYGLTPNSYRKQYR